jgi:two-component system sensor histidine kinase PilS (NtrC family)
LVVIYSSILLLKPGTLIVAALSGIQYGLLIDLEYYGLLKPFINDVSLSALYHPWLQVMYKVLITIVACFAVALLCRLLSEQERRTKEQLMMMEDRVKRVEKMAAMGEMAAGMAHEIRNPLASLTGSIQLLRGDVQHNPDHERLMQIVLRETERLNSLVDNFLLFARPASGKVETVELGGALSDIVSLFEKDNSCSSRITVNKHFSPDIWVEMDPGHLKQILWNLLMNAAEAIESEGTIGIESYTEKGDFACIAITDDGCGMSRALVQSIFNPFFTTKSRGTGLGLSIVHSILESYDGILDVESNVDTGTRFSMKLRQVIVPV